MTCQKACLCVTLLCGKFLAALWVKRLEDSFEANLSSLHFMSNLFFFFNCQNDRLKSEFLVHLVQISLRWKLWNNSTENLFMSLVYGSFPITWRPRWCKRWRRLLLRGRWVATSATRCSWTRPSLWVCAEDLATGRALWFGPLTGLRSLNRDTGGQKEGREGGKKNMENWLKGQFFFY